MKIDSYKFSSEEIKTFEQYRDNQSNPRIKNRFIALLMIAQGIDKNLAASVIGKSVYTLTYWFQLYYKYGIDRLNTLSYLPKEPYLNYFQINQVVIYVVWENPRNIKQINDYIREKTGICYSDDAVRKMLHKRGLKLLRPKKVPGNPPSVEEQQNFIKEYIDLRTAQKPGDTVLFADAMHLIHQPVPSLCWGDPAVPPVLPTNSGRSRLNILGAYDVDTHSLTHLTGEENCNGDRVVEFLDKIYSTYHHSLSITVYRDNAKYFLTKNVEEWLKEHPKLHLKPLPTYAPNLNLIERFWKFAKENLVNNKYLKEYKVFRAKVFQFLNNTAKYANELKKLMVDKFQIITTSKYYAR